MSAPHPALVLARESRAAQDKTIASPSKLEKLADGNTDVFKHSMLEAGHIVDPDTGEPYAKCPKCKHDFSKPKAGKGGKVNEDQGGLF